MAAKKIDLGGTGETVRTNVKRLRGGMQYKELAEKLAEAGRPIPTLGLRRIEAGERRVDVDDLMALAVVFDVSPLAILLPDDGAHVLASPFTGVVGREVAHNAQWLFGLGKEPLIVGELEPFNSPRVREFQLRSVPAVDERNIFDAADDERMNKFLVKIGKLSEAGRVPNEIEKELGPEAKDYSETSRARRKYLARIQGVIESGIENGDN